MVTLPWLGDGPDPRPNPNVEYSVLYDDNESDENIFHEPDDSTPLIPNTYRKVVSEEEIAGASSGPSLAAPLPPGLKIK